MTNVGSFFSNTWAIMVKELRSYFSSPLAYVITAIFLIVSGFLFSIVLIAQQNPDFAMRDLAFNLSVVLLFFVPAITMRLLSEEKRVGTIEMLLTNPVRDTEVVVGKFLASLVFLLGMLAFTLYYPLYLTFVSEPDRTVILVIYLGAILLGGLFLAIGIFASSITQNQVIAAILCFVFLLISYVASSAGPFLPGVFSTLVEYVGVIEHYIDFTNGVISLEHIVYYISGIVLFLFLSVRSLESRTWL